MITAGTKPDLDYIPNVEALPAEEAQDYVRKLIPDFTSQDESQVWFIHDGNTGTSHDFVVEAEERIQLAGTLASTQLEAVIDACDAAGDSFRIWWAGEPRAHLDVTSCATIEAAKQAILDQVNRHANIGVARGRKQRLADK